MLQRHAVSCTYTIPITPKNLTCFSSLKLDMLNATYNIMPPVAFCTI